MAAFDEDLHDAVWNSEPSLEDVRELAALRDVEDEEVIQVLREACRDILTGRAEKIADREVRLGVWMWGRANL